MLEILNINTNDLLDDQLDHETIDLGSSNFDTQSVNLDSSSLDPTALNPIRLSELEKAVDLLKSFGIVRYDANLNLTDKQKKQVKDNIGIADSGEILINTTDYWDSKLGYTPPAGTIIIYTDKSQIDGKPVPGIKVGSGNAYIQDLAFVSEEIENILLNHVDNSNVHVSLEDKSKWNNKQDAVDDLEDIRENASAGATAYQKPASGIPESDMSEGVQASLEKANSAVQTETDPVFSGSPAAEITQADINMWNAKQPAIADLADIREGATAGATALQSEEDPIFSASAASGITAEDIASWNEHTSNIGTITGVSVNGTSVATSGVANISSVPASILEGTIPNGITAITQNQGDGSNKIATTSYVDTAINNLPDPMIFRGSLGTGGTITTLPTASSTNVGYTYKVIEDGTYANQSAKIGDTFISDGSAWILIPSGDEPSGTVTSIKIEANSPIQIDNDAAISTSGTRTLSHATSGVTAGTYRAVTVNNTGHVTAGTTEAIYILTTTWGNTATQCYLRSQYFLNNLVPTQKGDLILCRGNGNLFKCGDLVYDSQEEVYYTNPTYLGNVLVAKGTSSQFVKGDGSLDSNTYAGAQTSGGAANKAVSIPFGQVDSTSTSTAFTATVDGITELRDGVCVYLKNGVVTSATNCTLNVNGLGAKPMYNTMAATTAISTQWNVNYTMLFIYNSTRVSGGCWDMYYGYDSDLNTIGYQLRTNSYTLPASDTSRYYKIFFTSADNTKYVPASADSTNSATSAKTVNQRPINPFGAIVYLHSTANFTTGTNVTATAIWQQYPITLGYSFNRTGAALTLTTSKPVFIKCAPQNDGSTIIDADVPYVQDLPTTEDGKIYIFLGVAYSATQVEMQMVHPVYYYKNGAINLWTGTGTQTDVSKVESSNVIDIGEYDLMKINEVKGKSLVWNQLAPDSAIVATGCTRSYADGYTTMVLTNETSQVRMSNSFSQHLHAGDKIIVLSHVKLYNVANATFYTLSVKTIWNATQRKLGSSSSVSYISGDVIGAYITVASNVLPTDSIGFYFDLNNGSTFTHTTDDTVVASYNIFNLTQMFGAGNEPTTVEEFRQICSLNQYMHNTGEVVGNNVEKLDVTGFNIWDEEWEVGDIDSSTGYNTVNNSLIRSKNYIPVLPETTYFVKIANYSSTTNLRARFYDKNKTYIGTKTYDGSTVIYNSTFKTGIGAYYMRFATQINYGTIYNHDICINKSNTSKNGTYEPYKHSEFPLNLTELTGKVNGEGTSVTIFPDGLHGVGTTYDSLIVDEDGYARRAVKRMGSVDLGSVNWDRQNTGEIYAFRNFPAGKANGAFNIICSKYQTASSGHGWGSNMIDKTVVGQSSATGIYVRDDSYTTAEDFKTAMSGVMLYYELATPIEYVLDTPVQCVAKVYPNGTVKQVPVMPDSTPMVMDVTYLHDNGGMIGGLMNRLASLEARIAALEGG